jgi:hypothetical protein
VGVGSEAPSVLLFLDVAAISSSALRFLEAGTVAPPSSESESEEESPSESLSELSLLSESS